MLTHRPGMTEPREGLSPWRPRMLYTISNGSKSYQHRPSTDRHRRSRAAARPLLRAVCDVGDLGTYAHALMLRGALLFGALSVSHDFDFRSFCSCPNRQPCTTRSGTIIWFTK